jgi:ABC-type polar amino acid transport system ATPase subunit
LQGLNFILAKGESCLIIGASGSGKSSLLRAIAGRASYSEGQTLRTGSNKSEMSADVRTSCRFVGFWLWRHFHTKRTAYVLPASKTIYAPRQSSSAASLSLRCVRRSIVGFLPKVIRLKIGSDFTSGLMTCKAVASLVTRCC